VTTKMDTPTTPGAETRILIASELYLPDRVAGPAAVVVADGVIQAVWRDVDASSVQQRAKLELGSPQVTVIDLRPWRAAPGFIDLHTHGLKGHDVTSGPQSDITAMACDLPRTGVTAFCPSIASTGRAETRRQVLRIDAARRDPAATAAEILGIRLEGPFISRIKKGAQDEAAIRPPDPMELDELAELGRVCIVDFAPEEDHGLRLLATLNRRGILASVGHTNATYAQAIAALDGGARHCTHLFNAMPPIDHRAPGTVGALLADRRATVEVIADGIHLHPATLSLVVAARGPRDVALVTDAVTAAGLPDGTHSFGGRTVVLKDGAVRLPDGTLAGSALTLDRAVRNMVTLVGVGWSDAIRMATLTPASIAGVADRKGCIQPGADADLVALNEQGVIQRVWTRGHLAYAAGDQSAK
jgi:N-acetylglucosamine-6-phosphate deacetylase